MTDLENIIARVYRLRADAKALEAEANELLDEHFGDLDYDQYGFGQYVLTVAPTKRFDPVLARKSLDPADLARIEVTKPDATLAKKELTPEEYASCQRTYPNPTRKIEKVEAE